MKSGSALSNVVDKKEARVHQASYTCLVLIKDELVQQFWYFSLAIDKLNML